MSSRCSSRTISSSRAHHHSSSPNHHQQCSSSFERTNLSSRSSRSVIMTMFIMMMTILPSSAAFRHCKVTASYIPHFFPISAINKQVHTTRRTSYSSSSHTSTHNNKLLLNARAISTSSTRLHSTKSPSNTNNTRNTNNILNKLQSQQKEGPLTSTKSQTIKKYASLSKSSSKKRTQHQMTIVEGHRLIIDTLANPIIRTLYRDVLVTEEALLHNQLGDVLSDRLQLLMKNNNEDEDEDEDEGHSNCQVRLATDTVVRAACDTVTPQGVVAMVSIPTPYKAPSKITTTKEKHNSSSSLSSSSSTSKSPFYLILDGLSDPGNVGTLLRSSYAVGIEAVILLPNSCDVWNPKVVRSSMGASFEVPIVNVRSWEDCLDLMKDCGVSYTDIYAATMDGGSTSTSSSGSGSAKKKNNNDDDDEMFHSLAHYEVDWTDDNRPKAICIGKEGTGLSVKVRSSVANGIIRSVHVPMETGIESLNAAVCGSVILFEYHRQLMTSSSDTTTQ